MATCVLVTFLLENYAHSSHSLHCFI